MTEKKVMPTVLRVVDLQHASIPCFPRPDSIFRNTEPYGIFGVVFEVSIGRISVFERKLHDTNQMVFGKQIFSSLRFTDWKRRKGNRRYRHIWFDTFSFEEHPIFCLGLPMSRSRTRVLGS